MTPRVISPQGMVVVKEMNLYKANTHCIYSLVCKGINSIPRQTSVWLHFHNKLIYRISLMRLYFLFHLLTTASNKVKLSFPVRTQVSATVDHCLSQSGGLPNGSSCINIPILWNKKYRFCYPSFVQLAHLKKVVLGMQVLARFLDNWEISQNCRRKQQIKIKHDFKCRTFQQLGSNADPQRK